MAKNRSRKSDGSSSKPTSGIDHLAKVAAAKAARIAIQTTNVIIAILYQLADNGLKSGRASGNVYMRNGRTRKMVVPALVQNGYTTPVRSLFSSLSSSWNSLTEAQQLTWINSSNYFRSNRFGVSFSLKGKQLYVSLNANLVAVGGAPVTDCPLPQDVNGITDSNVTAAAGTPHVGIGFSPTPTDADVVHNIYATAQLSAGVFKPSNSAFRLIGVIPAAQVSSMDATTMYTTKFGTLVEGGKIFIKLVPISTVTGQAGASIVASGIVAA